METPTPLAVVLLLLLSLANAFHLSSAGLIQEILTPVISLIPKLPQLPGQAPTAPLRQQPLPPLQPPIPPPGLVSPTGGKGRYPYMARDFVRAHNALRTEFGEPPLKWDKKLARFAQWWSNKQRRECRIKHSGSAYGENMFWGSGWDLMASDAVANWKSEIDLYDIERNECLGETWCRHFTQMVWNSTRRIGCGRAECYRGGVIITCNYDPPGNYWGERPFPLKHS